MSEQRTLLSKLSVYAKEHPLGYRVALWICGCSFIFIILSTAIQLAIEYRRELNAIDQQVEIIESSYLASLAKSLWDVDYAQVELQLIGIRSLPDVSDLYLQDFDNEGSLAKKAPASTDLKNIQEHSFRLVYLTGEGERVLGQLIVHFDLKEVFNRILRRGFNILINQTLLVLLIAFVILIIFQRMITRHLEVMANFGQEIGRGKLNQPLRLNRKKPRNEDELDQLVSSLNNMRRSIQAEMRRREQENEELLYNQDKLQQMVERRTASLLKAKDAAEEASNAKSRFLSTMSHEIRTPMNGMLGMIQLLDHSDLDAKQHQYVTVLRDSTEALLETLHNVLEYGRLVEGAYSVSASAFSLHHLLKNLIALLTPEANRKNITLKLTHVDMVDMVFTEENSLRQILTNLLSNAIKFTDQGSVELAVRLMSETETDQKVRFDIRDSGIGIEEKLQLNIFDRFTQADETITRRFGGTGLGLAICKELTEHLGGEIGVESCPGKGSTFWFELVLPRAEESVRKPADIDDDTFDRPLEILLVEDVEINQRVVIGLLALKNHKVTVADDGVKALELGRSRSFDLILMDMQLPGLSGLEVSRRLIQDPSCLNHKTRIIALTASVRPEDIHAYLEAGISNVIAKPVHKKQLYNALSETAFFPEDINVTATDDDRPPVLDQSVISVHRQMLGPDKLATLMQGFVKVYDEIWPALSQSILVEDNYDIAQLAHKLAGACDTIGFAFASQLLRELEDSSLKGVEYSEGAVDTLAAALSEAVAIAHNWRK